MKKLLILIRLSLIDAFEYRGDILIFTFSYCAQPVVYLLVWLAVASSSSTLSMSGGELSQYYIWLIIVQLWVSAWASPIIASAIRLGKLSPFLLKPTSYFNFQIGNNIGEKILKSVLILPIVLILSATLHPLWPNLSYVGWLLFVVSWVLAAIIYFLMDLSVGLVAFWLEESSAVDDVYNVLHSIFSGILIPLTLMPLWIRSLAVVLPFRYEVSLPLEILLHKLSFQEQSYALVVQIFWVAAMYGLVRLLWSKGIVKYSAVGA